MPWLTFPYIFSDCDDDEIETYKVKPRLSKGFITINTNLICAYNEHDNKNTMTRMANGECYELPITIEDFEAILKKVDTIVDLSMARKN